jgi:hypothetical protein
MTAPYDKSIGFSGHQSLSAGTRNTVRTALIRAFSKWGQVLAVTSLAAGGDQIFAECALAASNDLMVVIPCDRYESTFANSDDLATYRKLLKSSVERIQLPFPEPSEKAYWAAGRRIVDMTDFLVAVWDGLPAGGLGGTADVVHYAENLHKEVLRIWPPGASRG